MLKTLAPFLLLSPQMFLNLFISETRIFLTGKSALLELIDQREMIYLRLQP